MSEPQRHDRDHETRRASLHERLSRLPGVAVAFSGGVDSSVLLHAAHAALGERAVGVIADSPSLPRSELALALATARAIGARLEVVRTDELERSGYRANDGARCYFCKHALFDAMAEVARREGLVTLAFGEITDDLLDQRPGARAAAELGVVAPLRAAGFSKEDVRRYAREHGLAVAEKPASACLASRLPLGTEVTRERLARIEAAEERLRGLGFHVLRVRDRGALAGVELGPAELERGHASRAQIAAALRPLGFTELALDAYRTPQERAAAGTA